MAEDFNMDFMGPDSESSNKYRGLINFLKSTYGITIENNVKIGTTKHGSCLNAIFCDGAILMAALHALSCSTRNTRNTYNFFLT